jgi:hypothetical protein
VTPRRLASDTYSAVLLGGHLVTITVSRDAAGHPVEVLLTTGGKIGQAMDQMLVDLGVAISRAIQDRDPSTGLPVSES